MKVLALETKTLKDQLRGGRNSHRVIRKPWVKAPQVQQVEKRQRIRHHLRRRILLQGVQVEKIQGKELLGS